MACVIYKVLVKKIGKLSVGCNTSIWFNIILIQSYLCHSSDILLTVVASQIIHGY